MIQTAVLNVYKLFLQVLNKIGDGNNLNGFIFIREE